MKYLVTGGAGFIGSHLVDTILMEDDAEVVVVDNLVSGDLDNLRGVRDDIDIIEESVVNSTALRAAFGGFRPDVVFHLAAAKRTSCELDPRVDLDVNALGTLQVLEMCREFGVRQMIYSSTGSVIGKPTITPTAETHPTLPLTYYGISKLAAENYVRMYRRRGWVDAIAIRYFHVYGPRQRDADNAGGVIGIFCRKAIQSEPLTIFGRGDQQRCFTYVDDVVRMTKALQEGLREYSQRILPVFHLVNQNPAVTVFQAARDILALNDYQGVLGFTEPRDGDIMTWDVSDINLERVLRDSGQGMYYNYTPFGVGLEATFNWYKEKYDTDKP